MNRTLCMIVVALALSGSLFWVGYGLRRLWTVRLSRVRLRPHLPTRPQTISLALAASCLTCGILNSDNGSAGSIGMILLATCLAGAAICFRRCEIRDTGLFYSGHFLAWESIRSVEHQLDGKPQRGCRIVPEFGPAIRLPIAKEADESLREYIRGKSRFEPHHRLGYWTRLWLERLLRLLVGFTIAWLLLVAEGTSDAEQQKLPLLQQTGLQISEPGV